MQVDADKVAAALTALQRWAEDHGLKPSEVEYQELQFTTGGDPDPERAYRTHWASPELPAPVVGADAGPETSSSSRLIARGRAVVRRGR